MQTMWAYGRPRLGPAVSVLALALALPACALLPAIEAPEPEVVEPAAPIELNGMSGYMAVLSLCGGSLTSRVVIVARHPSGNGVAVVLQSLNPFDDPALELIFETVTRID